MLTPPVLQEHDVPEVVVEAVQPGAVHFACGVLQGEQVGTWKGSTAPACPSCPATHMLESLSTALPHASLHMSISPDHVPASPACPPGLRQGVVALPPTELSYYDLEEDITDMELRLERYLAQQEVGGWGMSRGRWPL